MRWCRNAACALVVLLCAAPASAQHFRWAVKTGTDAAAKSVTTTKTATVQGLARLARPSAVATKSGRLGGAEKTIFTIHARLLLYRLESDGDFHIVLEDLATDSTLISEIPDPARVGPGSPWRPRIQSARAAFAARFHPTANAADGALMPITVTGVGFFDKRHDAEGAAANGIELHPVLGLSLSP